MSRASPDPKAGLLISGLVAMGLLACGCQREAPMLVGVSGPSALWLGALPFAGREATRASLQPLALYLESELGRPVRVRVADHYDALERSMKRGALDLVWGPHATGAEPRAWKRLAQPLAVGGGHRGLLLRRPGPVTVTALVHPESRSGCIAPLEALGALGVDPRTALGRILWVGSHQAVLDGLAAGWWQAGAASESLWRVRSKHDQGGLEVWARSDAVAPDPLWVRTSLDPELARRAARRLGEAGREPASHPVKQALDRLGLLGFKPSSPPPPGRDATLASP